MMSYDLSYVKKQERSEWYKCVNMLQFLIHKQGSLTSWQNNGKDLTPLHFYV